MTDQCSEASRLLFVGAAFCFASGLRFAYLRWRELRVAEARVREALHRVEIATARIDAISGLFASTRPRDSDRPPP